MKRFILSGLMVLAVWTACQCLEETKPGISASIARLTDSEPTQLHEPGETPPPWQNRSDLMAALRAFREWLKHPLSASRRL